VAESNWLDLSTSLHQLANPSNGDSIGASWFLMVRSPESLPFLLEVSSQRAVSFGRLPECTVCSQNSAVSRKHAVVSLGAAGLHLRDSGSRNGCKVNGDLIAPNHQSDLRDGDVISIGPMMVTVTRASAHRSALPDSTIALAPSTKACFELASRVARVNTTVLLHGETGCGKEVLAEAIHKLSARSAGPLVRLNCASFPENLLESELFGHEKGAFTGADKRRIGFIEGADGGTLFLDEIGEMPASTQAKMLRVLESRTVTRVGSNTPIQVDIRLISATHRSLPEDIETGRFRADLFYRLSAFTIEIPSLRERVEDIIPLANLFLSRTGSTRPPALSPAASEAMTAYSWPGNIRELKNAIEHALVLTDGVIEVAHLPAAMKNLKPRALPKVESTVSAGAALPSESTSKIPLSDLKADLDAIEKESVIRALKNTNGNQSKAAIALGVSRRALIHKMEKFGLKPKANASDD
jgi:two-component system, NtrC family, response regulator AtoC